MRIYACFLVVFCFLLTDVNAQKLQRAFSFGNPGIQYGRKIAYDANGNFFVAGSFTGSNMDVDPSDGVFNLNSAGDHDCFIAKYDPYGIFISAISLGGIGNDQTTSIAVDSSGDVYITGWFRNTVDFDPSGTGVANVVSNGHSGTDMGYDGEIFLAKYSNDLQYKWAFGIGGPFVNDAGLAVKIDKNGDVLLAGNFRGTNVDFDPSSGIAPLSASGVIESFIAKYSSSGSYIWAKGVGGSSTVSGQVRDMAIDNNNNIYAVGHFDGSVDLNPGAAVNNITSAGCGDIYLVKLSSGGDYKWGFRIGGSNCDYPVSVVTDSDNNAYVAGYFKSSNMDFDPGSATFALSATNQSYDIFMAKYDSSGSFVFAKRAGGTGDDIGYDLALRSDGFVLVGYFSGTVDFDPSAGTSALTSAGSNDGFVAHYTLSGNYVSAFRIGSVNQDAVYGVYADRSDVITITGFFNTSNVDFDPSSLKYTLPYQGQNDVFVAKYYDLDLRNTIKGSLFVDKNSNNAKDADEPFFPGAKLVSFKENVDTIITVSSNGKFSFAIDTGQYITTAVPFVSYYQAVPARDTVAFSTYMNSDSISFAIQPIPGIKDLTVVAVPLTPVRPGFVVLNKLMYFNKGTDTVKSVVLQFVKPNKLNFDSASAVPDVVSGDTLRWNIGDVAPRSYGNIVLHLRAVAPPNLNNGDSLRSITTIFPIVNDSTPLNNVFPLDQIAVGSYDPNDKRESHGGKMTASKIAEGEYLQYTIRFQNTGTDTAFNISVRDTLSEKLDWSTLEMLTSSHDYQLAIKEGNRCQWSFADIKLVDSVRNEPLSHGFIVFKIKPKSDLSIGDLIENKVSIYFDYNLPVVTNTEQTFIVSEGVLPVQLISFTARRDAKSNKLTWITTSDPNTSHFEVERSINGRSFNSIGKVSASHNGGEPNYDFTDVQPGKTFNYYRLKMFNKDGSHQFSPIRRIDNTTSMYAEVYPNPADKVLTLKIVSDNRNHVQYDISSFEGKTFYSKKIQILEGASLLNIDVSEMAPGQYVLRLSTGTEQIAVRFIKI